MGVLLLLFFYCTRAGTDARDISKDRQNWEEGVRSEGRTKGGHRMTGVKDIERGGGKKSLFQSGVVEQG